MYWLCNQGRKPKYLSENMNVPYISGRLPKTLFIYSFGKNLLSTYLLDTSDRREDKTDSIFPI